MNKTELVAALAQNGDTTKVEAEKNLANLINTIESTLKTGSSVTLRGFGTFKVVERKAKTGRNPKTGETISIPARKAVTFKAQIEL